MRWLLHSFTDFSLAQVKEARKRILVMEYIQGGRVDDLVYLSDHNIDRNKVSLELARIFCQMVHINGWFHAVGTLEQWMWVAPDCIVAGSSSR